MLTLLTLVIRKGTQICFPFLIRLRPWGVSWISMSVFQFVLRPSSLPPLWFMFYLFFLFLSCTGSQFPYFPMMVMMIDALFFFFSQFPLLLRRRSHVSILSFLLFHFAVYFAFIFSPPFPIHLSFISVCPRFVPFSFHSLTFLPSIEASKYESLNCSCFCLILYMEPINYPCCYFIVDPSLLWCRQMFIVAPSYLPHHWSRVRVERGSLRQPVGHLRPISGDWKIPACVGGRDIHLPPLEHRLGMLTTQPRPLFFEV